MPKVRPEIAKLSDDEWCKRLLALSELRERSQEGAETLYWLKKVRSEYGVEHYWVKDHGNSLVLTPFEHEVRAQEVQPTLLPPATPPRVVEGVFWLVLPRKIREGIMGDAAEAYAQTMQRYGGRR